MKSIQLRLLQRIDQKQVRNALIKELKVYKSLNSL